MAQRIPRAAVTQVKIAICRGRSLRDIAREFCISADSVLRIKNCRRPPRSSEFRRSEGNGESNGVRRCPKCGGKLTVEPCLLCQAREAPKNSRARAAAVVRETRVRMSAGAMRRLQVIRAAKRAEGETPLTDAELQRKYRQLRGT